MSAAREANNNILLRLAMEEAIGNSRQISCNKDSAELTPSRSAKVDEKRLRILHVINSLGVGGTERGILKLMAGLDPARFEQGICAIRGADPEVISSFQLEGKVLQVGIENSSSQFLVFRLTHLLRSYRPHIVHSRNWGAIEAIPAGRLARVPVVIHSEHGYELEMLAGLPLRQRLVRGAVYRMCDTVFTVSNNLREYHGRQGWVSEKRIQVVPNGVDTNLFAPSFEVRKQVRERLGYSPGSIVIGTVGRVVAIKNQIIILKAAEQLLARGLDVRVLLVGTGHELDNLRKYAEGTDQLCRRVTFAGRSLDVAEMFQAMDIFVLPSIYEGMSNTILEAMASGLPCLATDVGGNPELITNGGWGYLFDPRDVTGLIEALTALIQLPELRKQFGLAARKRALTQFSLERMMERYTRLYTANLERRGVSTRS